jgi:hypothetical protein
MGYDECAISISGSKMGRRPAALVLCRLRPHRKRRKRPHPYRDHDTRWVPLLRMTSARLGAQCGEMPKDRCIIVRGRSLPPGASGAVQPALSRGVPAGMCTRLLRGMASIVLGLAWGVSAHAAELQWCPAGAPGCGGTGNWNTSSAFWYDGSSFQTWNNASLDNAIFGGDGRHGNHQRSGYRA